MSEITGRTRVFGILADPIEHVKTPEAINRLMQVRAFDGVLVPFHVDASGLAALVEGLRQTKNFGGAIATVPHKVSMLHLCDRLEPNAVLVGAVNCFRRESTGEIVGTNVDGAGFIAGLRAHGIAPEGKAVYLAGAGGAAAAIAFALAEAGVVRLTIYNRTWIKAAQLAARVAASFPGVGVEATSAPPSDEDLVVNATSLGMRSADPLPVDPSDLKPHQCVVDIIMDPAETPLLRAARDRGCRVHYGKPMLDGQVNLMAAFMGVRR